MRYKYIVLFLFVLPTLFRAQTTLNAYAKVSAVSDTSLTVINVNETNHTFTVGGSVIIMQMQDDVIGANTGNNANFGDLSAIANAGRYEVGVISSRSPAAGTPTRIVLSAALSNTYNTGTNSSVQLITFRNMGTNYTTTGNISGLAWDGNVGGVIAFYATNTLTLLHSVSANVLGFNRGAGSASAGGGCNATIYQTNSNLQGFKGEGIYKVTNANYTNGRGHLLNGGGGGNEHNAGGTGGGNYRAGGAGGPGYGCGTNAGGLGGVDLSAHISASRIFMGGGGGGGGQNNGANTDGGRGGGIVLIKANTLISSGTCNISITANGGSAANIGNDGAGGGGAAGTILLNVNTFSIASTCALTITANGGDGGDCGDGTVHAGGGGGSQGVVIYTIAQPTTNMTTNTSGGTGGNNSSGGGGTAGAGAGTNNAGIIPSAGGGPLPIELIQFKAEAQGSKVSLDWSTASEKDNDFFTVERSEDGVNFASIGRLSSAGSGSMRRSYQMYDYAPLSGLSYYRLKQTDYNGLFEYSPIVVINIAETIAFSVFPNPTRPESTISIRMEKASGGTMNLTLYDLTGKELLRKALPASSQEYQLDMRELRIESGTYLLKLENGQSSAIKRLVVIK